MLNKNVDTSAGVKGKIIGRWRELDINGLKYPFLSKWMLDVKLSLWRRELN